MLCVCLQQQAELQAPELLRKQDQFQNDLEQSTHQLQQAECKLDAELSLTAARPAERTSAKTAEVQSVKEVSSLS